MASIITDGSHSASDGFRVQGSPSVDDSLYK